MKIFCFPIVITVLLVIFSIDADGQTRRTTRPPAKPTVAVTNSTPSAAAAEMKAGAEKVSIQIKNVTKFLYLLGGVARGIEDIDNDRNANRAARDANETNKRNLIQTIRNLRAGLATLEVEFRTKDPLKKHLSVIQGITDLTAQTEDLALSGRFSDSGKPLLTVVEKLSDTLVALR
jgi:hypothetical protein